MVHGTIRKATIRSAEIQSDGSGGEGSSGGARMTDEPKDEGRAPLPQRLYESIWLWAAVAVLFWFLSYVVWGFVDLTVIPGG